MQAPSNRMGTERIPILVLKLGLPIMLSMALEALYNIIDSLYSLKTAEDSAKVESLRKKSNNFRTQLYLNIKEAIKDASDAWYLAKDLDGYNTAFFDQIANAFEEPDSLLYDFTITVSKERLPEADKTKLWEKTFKAYYNK